MVNTTELRAAAARPCVCHFSLMKTAGRLNALLCCMCAGLAADGTAAGPSTNHVQHSPYDVAIRVPVKSAVLLKARNIWGVTVWHGCHRAQTEASGLQQPRSFRRKSSGEQGSLECLSNLSFAAACLLPYDRAQSAPIHSSPSTARQPFLGLTLQIPDEVCYTFPCVHMELQVRV
eukprot:31772-Pleurochrysis_carterae.AAC.2